jgi:hypothetical protein
MEYIIYGSKTLIYSVVTIKNIEETIAFSDAKPELETIINKTSRHAREELID